MTPQEELEQKVRESGSLVERLESCCARIGKMCSEGRPPKMTIPVQWYDDDFFISVTLKDAQQYVQRNMLTCEEEGCNEPAVMFYCETHAP